MSGQAEEVYNRLHKRVGENEVRPRVDDELIREHQETPIGQHSDDLVRVKTWLSRTPADGRYIIVETVSNEEWCLGRLSGTRGEPPEILREERYESQQAAEHAVFCKRVKQLRDGNLEGTHGERDYR